MIKIEHRIWSNDFVLYYYVEYAYNPTHEGTYASSAFADATNHIDSFIALVKVFVVDMYLQFKWCIKCSYNISTIFAKFKNFPEKNK